MASGCTMDHQWNDPPYADLIDNQVLLGLYGANAADDGRVVRAPADDGEVVGSTDMGNVSYLTPSIHPMVQVAPRGVPIHTPEFATHARGQGGDLAVRHGARAMATTVVDLLAQPALIDAARAEWQATTEGGHPAVL